jgi:hypothetical protein
MMVETAQLSSMQASKSSNTIYADETPVSLQFTVLEEIRSGLGQRRMDVFGFETFFIWIFRGHGL